jgi:hypothetical protein
LTPRRFAFAAVALTSQTTGATTMITATTPEDEQALKGEFLDWRRSECHVMSEDQFMTAQAACAQAWGALRSYLRDNPSSVFSELCAHEAPYRLSQAIITAYADSVSPMARFKSLSIDQLCDAALTRMGFKLVRDEFGVDIVGDTITFEQATA